MTFKEWTIIFTTRLKEQMTVNNISRKELADACGCTEVSISKYLEGTRTPKAPVIAKMAETLHVTTDYLLGTDYDEMVEDIPR